MFKLSLTLGLSLIASSFALAVDSDPGYGPRTGTVASAKPQVQPTRPTAMRGYFRPTQRYYGAGFTVAYRYVPWNDRMPRYQSASFEGEQFVLPATTAAQTYAGLSPRVTYYYDRRSSTQPVSTPITPATGVASSNPKALPPIAEKTGR